jgi:hypothetical protein
MNVKAMRPLAILARSLHRELEHARYSPTDIVRFVNELLELVAHDLKRARVDAPRKENADE